MQSDAAQRVEHEGAEVGGERDRQQGVGQGGHLVVGGIAEARKEAVGQRLDGGVGGSAGVAEEHADGDAADDGGDGGERPDGAVRGEVFAVQDAEVAGAAPYPCPSRR